MLDPGFRDAWRPSDAQLLHTLAVGDTLAALLRTGRLGSLVVTSWRGEAELRAWHRPGEPIPDLQVEWTAPGREGRWCVEVDRGTESRNAWRRKLARYVHVRGLTVLVVTTSDARARNLAILARELGVAALTTDAASLAGGDPVQVYDALKGVRRLVDE
ncbi:MAG TPA: replication-relaxation family protein [Frankiaceae bacterium]|nr:replication-relaxation family protein [Frankiaceae bacterium]